MFLDDWKYDFFVGVVGLYNFGTVPAKVSFKDLKRSAVERTS